MIQIPLTASQGIILATAGKYCPENIQIIPQLQAMDDTVTEFSQLSGQVAAWLAAAEAAYTDDNFASVSVAGDYADAGENHDDPAGCSLEIPQEGTLYLYNEADPAKSWQTGVSAGSHTVYNLIPGQIYRWLCLNAAGELTAAGRLKATGSLRQIGASGDDNCRDLGGFPCDGGRVKYGRLYRGVFPEAGAALANTLRDVCHVQYEMDIECDSSSRFNLGEGVAYGHFPLNTPASYEMLYSLDETENPDRDMFRAALVQAMENACAGIGTYIHCSRGADRTGAMCFFLQAVLGMRGRDLDIHYEATALMGSLWGQDITKIRRTFAPWVNLRSYFQTLVSGGSLLENVLYWCGRAGIQAELVNRYRTAMTDGNPDKVAIQNLVTTHLTLVTGSNAADAVANGEGFETVLTPDSGAVMARVTVTMGGVDVTDQAYDRETGTITLDAVTGDIVITAVADTNLAAVTYALTNVTSSNTALTAALGESYTTMLSPAVAGYAVSGVVVTMGGEDITGTAWEEETNTVTISQVTGNISITAVQQTAVYDVTNLLASAQDETGAVFHGTGYLDGAYISGDHMEDGGDEAYFTTGYLENQFGKPLTGQKSMYIRGVDIDAGGSHLRLYFYDTEYISHSPYIQGIGTDLLGLNNWFTVTKLAERYYRLTPSHRTTPPAANWNGYAGSTAWIRFSFPGSGSGVYITFDEPIE